MSAECIHGKEWHTYGIRNWTARSWKLVSSHAVSWGTEMSSLTSHSLAEVHVFRLAVDLLVFLLFQLCHEKYIVHCDGKVRENADVDGDNVDNYDAWFNQSWLSVSLPCSRFWVKYESPKKRLCERLSV